jgi:hypothetical protein
MATEPPHFQAGEYVMLTRPYLGLPARSVGVISELSCTHPRCYLVYFGESLPVGPFPEAALFRLRSAHTAPKERTI